MNQGSWQCVISCYFAVILQIWLQAYQDRQGMAMVHHLDRADCPKLWHRLVERTSNHEIDTTVFLQSIVTCVRLTGNMSRISHVGFQFEQLAINKSFFLTLHSNHPQTSLFLAVAERIAWRARIAGYMIWIVVRKYLVRIKSMSLRHAAATRFCKFCFEWTSYHMMPGFN